MVTWLILLHRSRIQKHERVSYVAALGYSAAPSWLLGRLEDLEQLYTFRHSTSKLMNASTDRHVVEIGSFELGNDRSEGSLASYHIAIKMGRIILNYVSFPSFPFIPLLVTHDYAQLPNAL